MFAVLKNFLNRKHSALIIAREICQRCNFDIQLFNYGALERSNTQCEHLLVILTLHAVELNFSKSLDDKKVQGWVLLSD